jgi:hypothetical protein
VLSKTELSFRNQFYLGLFLSVLLLGTRSTHFTAIHHLPSAAWAVFFLAGLYLRPAWVFPVFFGAVATSDILSIAWGGGANFCVFTPAYAMTLPSFGALWLAGRWYSRLHSDSLQTIPFLIVIGFLGIGMAELFSSGGFYLFSGRFDPTFAEFGEHFAKYFPHTAKNFSLYIGLAALLHVLALTIHRNAKAHGGANL